MIPLSYLTITRVSGPDATDFLQSQLTADIQAIAEGQASFAAYCTPRGQVLGLILVCRRNEDFLLIGATELLDSIIKRLKIFVMRSKVQFDELPDWRVVGLEANCPAPSGFDIFSAGDLPLFYALGSDSSLQTDDSVDHWKCLEFDQGIVWLDGQTTEKFIPQMLGQDKIGALSFSKGCYPGQEIVARTRYLGKVKRTPLVVTLKESAQAGSGSKLKMGYAEQSVSGVLVDSADTDASHTKLFVITNQPDGESPVSVEFGDQSFEVAEVTAI